MKRVERVSTRHANKFLVRRWDSIRNVRRHIMVWLILVGILIAATGLQLSFGQKSYQTSTGASGGTYAEAVVGNIDTLNPLYATTESELAASHLMFSSLYGFDRAGSLHADLADDIKVDDSGKTYTVKIRQDVYWHDGEPLTAKDVAYTVNLIKNPAALSPLRVNWSDVRVKTIDDETVEFTLPAAYAAFPYALTFSVLPAHILASVPAGAIRENAFSMHPVGSGPFIFKTLQSSGSRAGHKIVQMSAYDKYHRGFAKVSRFEIHAYSSRGEASRALKQGEVNATSGAPTIDADALAKSGFSVSTHALDSGVYALFNVTQANLTDKRVRQALQYGTDTAAVRESLPVKTPSLDLPFVNGQIEDIEMPSAPTPSQKKANSLLDEAGWALKDGTRQKDGQKLTLTITTTKDDDYEKVMEGLASQWRKLGLVINTNIIDPSAPGANFVQNILQPRNYDVLVYELLIGADPDVYAYWHSSQIGSTGYNFSNYSNSVSDAALVSARSRVEKELRNAKYKTFASQWLDDVPAVGIYQPVMVYAASKHINSLAPDEPFVTPADHYATVLDWTVRERTVYKTP